MSNDRAYGLEIQDSVTKAVGLGGPISEQVAHAAMKFMATELVQDPHHCGRVLDGKYFGKGLLYCKRDAFKVIFRIDDVRRVVIVHGIMER